MEELQNSLAQYNEQLQFVNDSLAEAQGDMRESLLTLKSQMQKLIQVTQESLDAQSKEPNKEQNVESNILGTEGSKNELDDEYALFMQEMSKSGAYSTENNQDSTETSKEDGNKSDIEDELATLLGMKCAVYHTHKWGGQPSLHNAMVSSVEPHQDNDQFSDLQVRVLFTHPTHAEMLPCPFYLDGECKFSDEQCRYSHGALVQLSSLKEAIDPNYETIKPGSRILLKLKPADGEDISVAKKSTEKYHLWHIAVVKSVDFDTKECVAKLENCVKTGEKRKISADEFHLSFEEIFPLSNDNEDVESDDSLSDTEYPDNKSCRTEPEGAGPGRPELLVEKSLLTNTPAIGEWERYTRGIGSKLLLSMGYVPGCGLGAAGAGRLQPVEARALPAGRTLDHCMQISQAANDPLKVEQKLKRLQKREEERNKRAYEREKERERRNVFNFLNRTLGDSSDKPETSKDTSLTDIKQSTNKDLNIEQFKITQDSKRVELELNKLKNSLNKYPTGSSVCLNIKSQIAEKSRELDNLKSREQNIEKEQRRRKDKKNMTVF
ncbi:zinc finger CCCH-type with G patch domain-containing protein [Papilio machaon]|uniref:zinc finger CCCH-type with G patch domain-containing protein n=1 Tax=Papilio machaon TaxID=76193 RepID=UPI001E6632B9|nr:zinc finger CCCH-type with G patch domain-containing protein [Papilio machaon]